MNQSYGAMLRYHRKKRGLSQQELAKGICVSSYLSKIENGELTVGQEIIIDFMTKLDLKFLDDQEIIKERTLLEEAFDAILNLRVDQGKVLFESIKKDLSLSNHCYMYLTLKHYFEADELAYQVVKKSLPHMNIPLQHKLALVLYDKHQDDQLLLDQHWMYSGYGCLLKGMQNLRQHAYKDALERFQEGEHLYLKNGMVKGMFQCIKLQGILYSLASRYEEALVCFERLYKMCKEIAESSFQIISRSTYYNIHYLRYLMERPNDLENLLETYIDQKQYSNSMLFHVLFEIYLKKDKAKAEDLLLQGLKEFSDETTWEHQLLKTDWMILRDPSFRTSDAYYDELKRQMKSLEASGNHMLYNIWVEELIAFLKQKRRYKEALTLVEQVQKIEL